jgi:predicted ABC-type transport system involved in lysophospholipase L1 biosynthesis ATPase subunit
MVTGHDVGQLIDGALAEFRLKITGWMFLPESFALLTDEENVALGLRIQGRSIAAAGTAARAPVKVVQLEEQAHQRGCEMLGGEPPWIPLARALVESAPAAGR